MIADQKDKAETIQPPVEFSLAPEELWPDTINAKAAMYGATTVPAAPPIYRFISKSFQAAKEIVTEPGGGAKRTVVSVSDDTLVVPDGCEFDSCFVRFVATDEGWLGSGGGADDGVRRYLVTLGNQMFELELHRSDRWIAPRSSFSPLSGAIPVTITGSENRAAEAVVIIRCKRTDAELNKWQLEAFFALQEGHDRQVKEYDDRMRAALRSGSLEIAQRNLLQNREIERDEIKRNSISILTEQYFSLFGSVDKRNVPKINFDEARAEGHYIQFFEQAFEWNNMDFLLFPYFWSNPDDWRGALSLRMDDPLHEQFLRAGATRVVVPVRKGFEPAMVTYLSHPNRPILWDGEDYDDIDIESEMYLPLWAAIRERQGQTEDTPVPIEKPWRYRISTDNQIISGSSTLPTPPPSSD
jgi:hypothetical protein